MSNRLSTFSAWLILALVAALSGCATKRPPAPKMAIEKIALIPVVEPSSFYTKNEVFIPIFPGPAALINLTSNREKSGIFNQKMQTERASMGARLTKALEDELRSAGFVVTVLDNVPRPKDGPEDIDYAKLATRDPVLHVWFSDVSMHSKQTSSVYIPRMNVTAYLLPKPESDDAIYNETIYYGVDSRGDKYWSIPSDPKYSYPNFDDMISRSADVAQGYDVGIQAIAKRLARELKKQF